MAFPFFMGDYKLWYGCVAYQGEEIVIATRYNILILLFMLFNLSSRNWIDSVGNESRNSLLPIPYELHKSRNSIFFIALKHAFHLVHTCFTSVSLYMLESFSFIAQYSEMSWCFMSISSSVSML